jgi:phosphatidylserine/phosphatidylglycerophosphate/cardiolipin synthase-like enzyme
MMNNGSRYAYSRAWSRLQFRARSWINRRGGDTSKIAGRILKPFLRDLEKTHGPQSWEQVHESWRDVLNSTIRFGGCSEYNNAKVFHHGRQMFNDLWRDIDNAEKRIWIDTYTLTADYTGTKTIDKLTEAALRGCEVVVIVDAFGSSSLQPDSIQRLIDAGGHFYIFNKKYLRLWMFFNHHPTRTPWMRNHRKLIIIDDQIAYTGGMNIADEYSGMNILLSRQLTTFEAGESRDSSVTIENEPNYEMLNDYDDLKNYPKRITEVEAKEKRLPFRDTHARLTGPCVNYLSNAFMESLEEVSDFNYAFDFPDLFAISERKYLEKAQKERQLLEEERNSDDKKSLDVVHYPNEKLDQTLQPLEDDEENDKYIDRGVSILLYCDTDDSY